MSIHWAMVREELPLDLQCCPQFIARHKMFAIEEMKRQPILISTEFHRKHSKCIWCGFAATLTGIMVLNPPPVMTSLTGTAICFIGVDVIEIDEGEYDATKPPPDNTFQV